MTIAISQTMEDVTGYTVCLIPGGFTDMRVEAAYNSFRKDGIDYIVTAMRNGQIARMELQERGIPERKILVPPDNYFPFLSTLGDLTGAKYYLKDNGYFSKIASTKITAQMWCAPRFLVTAYRLGYLRPSLVKAKDTRSFSSILSDIAGEWLTDVPAYATLAMISPDFYLHEIEPRLQKLRQTVLRF